MNLKQNKILIVDDEKNILWVLKKGLEKNNFQADTVTSGEKALELLKKNEYLMMFSDIFFRFTQFTWEWSYERNQEENPKHHIFGR